MSNSRLIAAVAAALAIAGAAHAQSEARTEVLAVQQAGAPAAGEPDLDALLWVARPLVLFADSAADPRFAQQLEMIDAGRAELDDRLVVVLTDTDPDANGALRRELRPRGFGLVLIDTDGSVVQRRPTPTTVRELSGTIDRLTSRRQETGSRRR